MYINCYPSDELYHHGIKGQKWGVRRFQNADGSLTSEGRSRYSGSGNTSSGGVRGAASRATGAVKNTWNGLSDRQKKIAKGVAITAGVALAAYGGYKLSQVPAVRAGASKISSTLKEKGNTAISSIKGIKNSEAAGWFRSGKDIGRAGGIINNDLTGSSRNTAAARAGARVGAMQDKLSSVGKNIASIPGKVGNKITNSEAAGWLRTGRDVGRAGGVIDDNLTGSRRNTAIARAGAKLGAAQDRVTNSARNARNRVTNSETVGWFRNGRDIGRAGGTINNDLTGSRRNTAAARAGAKLGAAQDRVTNSVRNARNKVTNSEAAGWFRTGRDIGRAGGTINNDLTGSSRNTAIARIGAATVKKKKKK